MDVTALLGWGCHSAVLWGSEMNWSTDRVVNCSATTLHLSSLYKDLFTYLQWAGLFTTPHHNNTSLQCTPRSIPALYSSTVFSSALHWHALHI